MPDEVERKGLVTPETRAGVIEKLVRIGFVERQGNKKTKYLVPTDKGTSLITVMPEQIQSASMTAEWEQKLLELEKQIPESIDSIEDVGAGPSISRNHMRGIEDMVEQNDKSLSDRTDYAKNGEKTENGQFISSYACQAENVDEEFMLSKREYERLTGRHPRGNIITYQIRQSFKPGEITLEEAIR